MTTQERADKISQKPFPQRWDTDGFKEWVSFIAAQIAEAERETYDKAQKDHGDRWVEVALKARAEGFRAGEEKAKPHTFESCAQALRETYKQGFSDGQKENETANRSRQTH